jgi:glycosyltransferase involved in cell wall biosynthesis
MKAQIHYYPCSYEELFCIAVAESQVAGVLPITTPTGALESTNMGIIIDGDLNSNATQQMFVQTTIEALANPELYKIQRKLMDKARERFDLQNIMKQWSEKVFNE